MIVTLLEVIRSVHNRGWVHRDIKPGNNYFDEGDTTRIVFSDWSSAVRTGSELLERESLVTPTWHSRQAYGDAGIRFEKSCSHSILLVEAVPAISG